MGYVGMGISSVIGGCGNAESRRDHPRDSSKGGQQWREEDEVLNTLIIKGLGE